MLSNWAIKKLEHLTLDYMKLECPGGACYGVMGVSDMYIDDCLYVYVLTTKL